MSSLVQIIACRLFGPKLYSVNSEQILVEYESKYNNFQKKCI